MNEEKENQVLTDAPVESDETTTEEKQEEKQQVETEELTLETIDKRIQEMTQTIIDTITNLLAPVEKEVVETEKKEDDASDVNDWDNLDL
nr:MAG: hypothetical protein [Bacteriophage sp.]